MIGTFYLQTAYTMLESMLDLESIFKHAQKSKYDFIAIADKKLHALYKISKLSQSYQIPTYVGLEVTLSYDIDDVTVLLYPKNKQGFQSLITLSTELSNNNESFTLEKLSTIAQHLNVIVPAVDGAFIKWLSVDETKAVSFLTQMKNICYGLYVGLSLQSFDLEIVIAPKLLKIAESLDLVMVPTHKTSYMDKEDQHAYQALRKVQNSLYEKNDLDQSFYDKNQLQTLYSDYSAVFKHTSTMLKETYGHIDFSLFNLPVYPNKDQLESSIYLENLSKKGLTRRLKINNIKEIEPYQKRLDYELKVINSMGYADYFLIVYDIIKYAKDNQILAGPGRGSAAGSLVAYCIGITDVDPLAYGLLFERFLNPERKTMPDIDMDFPDDKRDEMILYVKEKYGKERVATITTFGTFAVKSSIRDIARVYQLDLKRTNRLVKDMMENRVDPNDEQYQNILQTAKKIEGLPRHTGTHAAGIILSNDSLLDKIPLQTGPHGLYQTQFEADDLAALGLLKIDFLGIRNLSVIDTVVNQLKIPFKMTEIPLDDKKTYDMLSTGKTTGIFQLESSGMRQAIKKIAPKDFEDIVALLALYRPGPMESIDIYVSRKKGEAFDYLDEILKPILQSTYGIIIYQEQIMSIAVNFAGYTLAQADLLRRGISKKDREILETERKRFVKGSQDMGHDEDKANEIYDYIVKFADYGFNRSHSVSYALVAYAMAYLKARYFKVFMSVLLSSVISNDALTLDYMKEVKEEGYGFIKPNIITSNKSYQAYEKGILLPLVLIKGLGNQTVDKIIEEREKEPFKDFNDFKTRMKGTVNERQLISLIYSGALDDFGLNKKTMIENRSLTQTGFEQFLVDYKMKVYEEYSEKELADFEKEAFGFNWFYHPLMAYQTVIKQRNLKKIVDQKGFNLVFLGYVTNIKTIKTKRNETMCFMRVSDGDTEIEVTVFPDVYQRTSHDFNHPALIFTVNKRDSYILSNIEIIK